MQIFVVIILLFSTASFSQEDSSLRLDQNNHNFVVTHTMNKKITNQIFLQNLELKLRNSSNWEIVSVLNSANHKLKFSPEDVKYWKNLRILDLSYTFEVKYETKFLNNKHNLTSELKYSKKLKYFDLKITGISPKMKQWKNIELFSAYKSIPIENSEMSFPPEKKNMISPPPPPPQCPKISKSFEYFVSFFPFTFDGDTSLLFPFCLATYLVFIAIVTQTIGLLRSPISTVEFQLSGVKRNIECPICLEEFSPETQVIKLSVCQCNFAYHRECFSHWNKCVSCNTSP